ncbi:DUF3987 domain-containing protein [Xanthomarina sp. F2636L]|uniref:DUF3987 domain-containing protein n=1 Tax=Xanthomarina sp. F2636L TaxID=2996018 RepID=UPI00225E6FCB|nr:DUF3987 domain-containing protein [Xanthomarina sp. F2636L]MCX7550887.1 DUF3987 domain-containing protein [Xanthomarina sp. F2636L]
MPNISIFKNFANKVEDIPLQQIINDIKEGKYKNQIESIRNLNKNGNTNEANELKKHLLGFTASGVFNTTRKADTISEYSGFVILDIDKLSESELSRIIPIIHLAVYTYAAFISPSGNGIKIIVPVNSTKEEHKEAYKQVVDYYEQALNIDIDTSGSDISRLCFMSYDPDCYFNKDAETYIVRKTEEPSKKIPSNPKSPLTPINNEFENYISEIEVNGIDITSSYENWRNIGFAISDEYGESGRDYFHRISKQHSKYDTKECDNQYTSCLNANGSGVNIATFYYHANQAGVSLKKERITPNNTVVEINKNETEKLPTFPESIYKTLPEILKNATHFGSTNQEKDMLLLGTLTCMSVCLHKVYGIYDKEKVYSNLFLFVTAPASAGKGKLKWCKSIIYPVHLSLREEAKVLKSNYESDLADYNKNKNKDENLEKPQKPPEKMLFIPANNSTTGVFQLLADSKARGIIFETEGDTLSQAFKTDYGNYSDGFRKAFHHETISYYRRTDREYVDMETPCLSTVLSGTPKQVLSLMPNAENGLFSRFIFYYLDISPKWKNVFEDKTDNGVGEYYKQLGEQFFDIYETLKADSEIKIELTPDQQQEFNEYFSNIQNLYLSVQSEEYVATVRRMGLIAFRFMMIFTALRITEDGDISNPRLCLDEDFKNAMAMVKVLIKHSSKVFSSLPIDDNPIKNNNRKEQFLNKLPFKFTTKEYNDLAIKLNINPKTAEGYITDFVKVNLIERISHGNYLNNTFQGNEGIKENEGK